MTGNFGKPWSPTSLMDTVHRRRKKEIRIHNIIDGVLTGALTAIVK